MEGVEHLLDDIHKAVGAELWLLAVTGSLLVPDVAGALAHPSGEAKGNRYRGWWDSTSLKPAYDGYLNSADAYFYRCSLAHQSTGGHPNASTRRVLFLPPGPATIHKIRMAGAGPGGQDAVALDIQAFVDDVVSIAREWLDANRANAIVSKNLARSVRLYPDGIAPFIVGYPVIG
jgi:hypothetical protein